MDSERQRIEEDLRGAIAGDVRCDDLFTQLYASDASIYQITPLGVVRPRNLNDVVTVVQYAAENELSIHARGAGSGLAGESLGRGLVVDFSRYFRRILETDESQVRAQAGVVLGRLNRHLAQTDRVFGPDPAMREITTLGGAVAIDAAGSHWPRYGSVRRHVRSLRGVLADGQPVELSQHSISASQKNGSSTRLQSLVTATAQLLERHASAIEHGRPKSLVNRSGYGLHDLVDGDRLDLAKLIVGSEGTLALVTDVTLSTEPIPGRTGCILLLFSSMDHAAQAALEIAKLEPCACDLMDRRHLTLARETDPRYEFLIPGQAEAVLLVEYCADTEADLRDRLDQTIELLQYKTKLAAGAIEATDDADAQLFWQLAHRFVPTLHRLKGSTRPIPCIEDIAVPPEALGVFLRHMHLALKRQQVTASLFGHAAHGQLHIRPFLDLANPDDIRKMESLAGELYEKVWLLGGTISGEHGDGLSRTPFLARQYGPLVNVFREVKQLFDPRGTLNPGKVVPTTNSRMTHDLRQVSYANPSAPEEDKNSPDKSTVPETVPELKAVPLQLNWEPEEITLAARACNGCGGCRTLSDEDRMCPIFRYAPREEASPRAKANMVRALLTGTLSQEEFFQEATKQTADLCVHCHMCRIECPSNVDIPKLMLEAKSLHVQTNGLSFHNWLLTRLDAMSNLAGKFPVVANWLLKHPQSRWIMEYLLGIAQGRKLPQFARRKFIRWATLRRLHRHSAAAGEKVLYFVDTYANQFDPELAKSLVAVLRHNGITTYVPTDQRHSAMAMIVQGALDPARRVAEHNVALLADAVRRGYTIVATEPSAALALTHEYPNILDNDDDALLVAKHTRESCHYLWQLHQRGQLRLDFQPLQVSVGYHVPCHVKALEVGTPAANLMQLIPELRLNRVEKGCSGMAGTFGLKRENYRSSLRAGFDLIHAIRDGNFQVGVTECSACKMQMEQGTSKPTIHPMKLIAMAYGLMPDLRNRLTDVSRPLVVT